MSERQNVSIINHVINIFFDCIRSCFPSGIITLPYNLCAVSSGISCLVVFNVIIRSFRQFFSGKVNYIKRCCLLLTIVLKCLRICSYSKLPNIVFNILCRNPYTLPHSIGLNILNHRTVSGFTQFNYVFTRHDCAVAFRTVCLEIIIRTHRCFNR